MKPRRPTEFEVFNSNVKQAIIKSDSVTEDVQKSRIPFKLDTYLGTTNNYFSDNGTQYIDGKQDIVFRFSSIPFRTNAYSKLQSSTYCKPFVKAGSSVYGDGVKKYYSSPSFSDSGTPLGVNRYLYTEISGNTINYYFLGDGTDYTTVGTKYYIRPNEVINNYLVPFTIACVEDKIIYPVLVFVGGYFVPWSRCYFAVSYEEFKIYIDMTDLKTGPNTYLVDEVKKGLITGDTNAIFYMLPFEVNYKENTTYANVDQSKTIFSFDSYGRSIMTYGGINSNTKGTFIEALINIKNIYDVDPDNIYDQVSDLFYCEVNSGERGANILGKTLVDFNKLDRMRKIFPNNIIVFNKDNEEDNLNAKLCTDTIRIYNNIVYVGSDGKTYYDQHIKVFFDSNSALSLTNLEFVSQDWLQKYTDALINFYITYGINYADSGEIDVPTNENKPIGLKVVDGILNAEYDPAASDSYNLPDPTQLGYTIKEGILCLEFDELNPNSNVINDNYISEQLNSGSLLVRSSIDMDTYDFDELNCYYYKAEDNSYTQLPINKATFFNIYNKVYHQDVYNRNKGKLPMMDQTIVEDQTFEIKDIGTLTSINNYYIGQNLTLKTMTFNDDIFIDKLNSIEQDPIGKFKLVYVATNPRNDRYGYTTIDADLNPGSTIDPDSLKMRSAKFIIDFMKDDVDSDLGLEVGYKGYQYNAKITQTVYTSYTYSAVAINIDDYTDSNGKLLRPVEVTLDSEHNSFYFLRGSTRYYVKEYSNEYYDSTQERVVNKTGTYLLNKEYLDFSGLMTILYDEDSQVVNEARMNNVQLSNSVITVEPNSTSTVNLTDVDLKIDTGLYISNFDYGIDPIITNFVATEGGSLTYENTGATVTVSDEDLLYNTFGNRVGTYIFEYIPDSAQWMVNGSFSFSNLSECGITYSGTSSFTIEIKVDTYPSWATCNYYWDEEQQEYIIDIIDYIDDITEQYGIVFDGICNVEDILSITYKKVITGLVEETYDEDAEDCQHVVNEYLQMELIDGVTNITYNSYLIDNTVDPYKAYPGRMEFVFNQGPNNWTVTVYRYISDDIIYKSGFIYDSLESFAIEYDGTPVDGDKIIVYYEPPAFQWNIYRNINTNTDSFIDGYVYSEEPMEENINISDYGVSTKATITQTSIINAKIYNEDMLAEKLYGVSGTYIFTYNGSLQKWTYMNDIISSIRDYGIDINGSIPNDQDYIIIELNTTNSPSWMDSMFITLYEIGPNCIEFPDGTYYNKETAIPIIFESYGVDISDYLLTISGNDKIIIQYHNAVKIPRYVLNLLINKFNYFDTFQTNESDVEDTYLPAYETYNDKITDEFKNYKLYEYELSTMLLNNQSIMDNYLKNNFGYNMRIAEYTRQYLINEVAKLINNKYYIDIPVKNRYAYMMDFENMFLNFYTNDNLTRDITSNIFRYQLGIDKTSGDKTPMEFMFFDNIDNSQYTARFSETDKFRKYDSSIINENMRLYTTTIPEDNEFIYPESENGHPIDMSFGIKYTINKIRYKGILTPGSSASNTIYTPAAGKGDFYYLKNNGYVNGVYVNASSYRLLLCIKDTYNAEEALFDELKPSTDSSTSWLLINGSDLIDGLTNDYSMLVLDQEYINVTLEDDTKYDTDLTIVSNNRFMYRQFQYIEPTGDYGAIDNDRNSIVLHDPDTFEDIFKYCDDVSRYMVFIAEKTGNTHSEYRYISSDQYRVSIPSYFNAPYYKRKMFFTFDVPDESYIAVFYLPITMQTVDFKLRAAYQDGSVIFDINYESKKDVHLTLNSELYMVFADGKKIPQSWVKKIGPDRLSIRDPNNTGSISYNNISIVRYLPTTIDARFDTYIDSNELTTIGEFDPTSQEFMKYIVKVGLNKRDLLNLIEKLAYRHRFASMGTSYYIDDTLTLNNYGYGMSEFVYWLYNDTSMTPEEKLGAFNYDAIEMSDVNSFADNNRFIESTIKLIREFYIENTLVPYNTHEHVAPTFSDHDNIAAKSEIFSGSSRYANDPRNTYIYPVLQDYRFDVIYGTYNIHNLTTNGNAVIDPGETEYSFYLYSVNNSILPDHIIIKIDRTGEVLIDGRDYYYNKLSGQVIIYSIVDNFTVTAYGEIVSYIEMISGPNKTHYYNTETFMPDGIEMIVHWTDGSYEPVEEFTWTHYKELLTTDITSITIIYQESEFYNYTIDIPITVEEATPSLNYVMDIGGTYYVIGNGTNGSGLMKDSEDQPIVPDDGIIVIPDTIYSVENDVIYPVKVIKAGAFRDIEGIDIVNFGNNIYDIEDYAFSGCSVITLNFNTTLLTIGNGAFSNCVNLENVSIPSSVVSIGISLFRGCTGLLSASVSNGLTYLSQTMFEGCTSLVSVNIFTSVISIGMECFSGCIALENITLHDNITSIGARAFYQCSALASIHIPVNTDLTTIQESTFKESGLTSILIPNNITTVEGNAFADCTNLTSATFQDPDGDERPGINNLGVLIFNNCTSLVNVVFGFTASVDKCTTSEIAWFKGCNSSLVITVPSTVYDPPVDLTETNYGEYWTYIDDGTNATYHN